MLANEKDEIPLAELSNTIFVFHGNLAGIVGRHVKGCLSAKARISVCKFFSSGFPWKYKIASEEQCFTNSSVISEVSWELANKNYNKVYNLQIFLHEQYSRIILPKFSKVNSHELFWIRIHKLVCNSSGKSATTTMCQY